MFYKNLIWKLNGYHKFPGEGTNTSLGGNLIFYFLSKLRSEKGLGIFVVVNDIIKIIQLNWY